MAKDTMVTNETTEKIKYTFLFGAGAEGEGQIGMPSGSNFKKDVILAKGVVDFADIFLGKTGKKLKEGMLLTANSTGTLYQTVKELTRDKKAEERQKEIKRLFKEDVEECTTTVLDYLGKKEGETDDVGDDSYDRFRKVYKAHFYDYLYDDKNREKEIPEDSPMDIFLKNAGIYGYYDSLFNYLRYPKLYEKEVLRVMKLYYASLKSIFDSLLKAAGEDNYSYEDLKKVGEAGNSRKCFLEKIGKLEKAVMKKLEDEKKTENLYYTAVGKLIQKNKENINEENAGTDNDGSIKIVTTNYTGFAKEITGIDEKSIFHIHGGMGLFEDVNNKRIAELSKFKEDEVIFPYLLTQSGVKPVINYSQLKTLYEGSSALMEAEELIIIGYGLNKDDEHILNVLKERLEIGRKIAYYLYVETDAKKGIRKGNKKYEEKFNEEKNRVKKLLLDEREEAYKVKESLLEFFDTTDFCDHVRKMQL